MLLHRAVASLMGLLSIAIAPNGRDVSALVVTIGASGRSAAVSVLAAFALARLAC